MPYCEALPLSGQQHADLDLGHRRRQRAGDERQGRGEDEGVGQARRNIGEASCGKSAVTSRARPRRGRRGRRRRVASTWVSGIRSSGIVMMSWDSTTRSASLPGSSEPRSCSRTSRGRRSSCRAAGPRRATAVCFGVLSVSPVRPSRRASICQNANIGWYGLPSVDCTTGMPASSHGLNGIASWASSRPNERT